MGTLSDRIKERMQATGMTNAQLAKAAGVKQPTAHNWGTGKTKAIKGEPLLAAAAALGVTPDWLATGKGPKYPEFERPSFLVREDVPEFGAPQDPWIAEAVRTLTAMSVEDRRAAVLNLRVFCQSLGPPGNGNNIPMAA